MNHNYQKMTSNILVRPLHSEDLHHLRTWRNDGSNTKYLRQIPHITQEQQINWFNDYKLDQTEMIFAIEETKFLNRIVGSAALYDFKENQAEFGKLLIGDLEARGKNVGINALLAIASIAFENLKLSKVILHCYKENVGAMKVYERAGFQIVDEYEKDDMTECLMCLDKNE